VDVSDDALSDRRADMANKGPSADKGAMRNLNMLAD
jgi:hypothetical protein